MPDEKEAWIRFQRHEPKDQLTADLLGFKFYLPDFVEDLKVTKPPYVIGLTGEWGIGKTTFMKFVKEELEKSANNKVFQLIGPVELWKFSGNMDLSAALISTITEKFEPKAKDIGKKLLDTFLSLISSSSVGIPGGVNIGVDAEKILAIWKGAEKELHEQFDELIKKALGDENSKLVVFVDDLDRCLPDQALAFLEKLRLFFDSERVIFIVALDEDVVADAIRVKFGSDVKIDGHWYLEKLLDRFYALPVPTPGQFEKFLWAYLLLLSQSQNSQQTLANIWNSIKSDNPHLWGRKALWNPRRLLMGIDQIKTIVYAGRRGIDFCEAAVCLFPLFLLKQSYSELYKAAKNDPFVIWDLALLSGDIQIPTSSLKQTKRGIDIISKKYGQAIARFCEEPSAIGLCRAVIIAVEITKNRFYTENRDKDVVMCLKEYIENYDRYE